MCTRVQYNARLCSRPAATSTRRQRGRRRRRRVVDVWCHSGSPHRETRIDFTRVTFFFSLARTKKEDELRRRRHHVSTRLICMNTDENFPRKNSTKRRSNLERRYWFLFNCIQILLVIIFIIGKIIKKY